MINEKCKTCRREREKLFLKGDRCMSPKCAMVKRPYQPGQHGQNFKGKISEYGRQLREKQKMKAIYGIYESKISTYYKKSDKEEGNTTLTFLQKLELRADNVLFKSGLAKSKNDSKQKISHGKLLLNGKKITIPSINLVEKDILKLVSNEKLSKLNSKTPSWLEINLQKKEVTIKRKPEREDIDIPANENLVAEFYSR